MNGKLPPELVETLCRLFEDLKSRVPRIEERFGHKFPETRFVLSETEDDPPMIRVGALRAALWAQFGWYPNLEIPLELLSQTAELLGGEKHNLAEERIAEWFEQHASALIQRVALLYPERSGVLVKALRAHEEGDYELSIPPLLIQADGIGCEYFDIGSIYSISEENFKKIKQKMEADPNILIINSMHLLIGCIGSMNATKKRRQPYAGLFNRHRVIHGEDPSYASKVNSLKSISWIYMLASLLHFPGESEIS